MGGGAMTLANDVISGLEHFTWRGLEAPCSDASYSYRNEQAERRYIYADVAGHESLGLSSIEVRAVLHFSNAVEDGLYPSRWEQWKEALRIGTPGLLKHPDIGTFDAVVTDVSVDLNASMRSGILVRATFVETRRNEDQAFLVKNTLVSIESAADNVVSLADLLSFPARYMDRIRDIAAEGAGAVLGQVTQTLGSITSMIDTVDSITSGDFLGNQRWVLRNQLLTLYFAVKSLDDSANLGIGARKTATHTVRTSMTLATLAIDLGNSVTDLAELNQFLLGKPTVPAGTVVAYYV